MTVGVAAAMACDMATVTSGGGGTGGGGDAHVHVAIRQPADIKSTVVADNLHGQQDTVRCHPTSK